MAISLTFRPQPDLRPAIGPDTLDLAGPKRPRCALTIPPVSAPGVYLVHCGCGAHAAFTVSGNFDDPQTGWLACWKTEPATAKASPGPAPGATLFSPRRSR